MLSGKEIAELKDVQHLTWPQIVTCSLSFFGLFGETI